MNTSTSEFPSYVKLVEHVAIPTLKLGCLYVSEAMLEEMRWRREWKYSRTRKKCHEPAISRHFRTALPLTAVEVESAP